MAEDLPTFQHQVVLVTKDFCPRPGALWGAVLLFISYVWISNIHNSFLYIHNSFLDIQNEFRISQNNYGYPKMFGYPEYIFGYPQVMLNFVYP